MTPSAASSASAASGSAQKEKKRRVSKACDPCRRKRVKCDATSTDRPCSVCLSSGSGDSCTFARPSRKRGPPAGQAKVLGDRAVTLERLLGYLLLPVNQSSSPTSLLHTFLASHTSFQPESWDQIKSTFSASPLPRFLEELTSPPGEPAEDETKAEPDEGMDNTPTVRAARLLVDLPRRGAGGSLASSLRRSPGFEQSHFAGPVLENGHGRGEEGASEYLTGMGMDWNDAGNQLGLTFASPHPPLHQHPPQPGGIQGMNRVQGLHTPLAPIKEERQGIAEYSQIVPSSHASTSYATATGEPTSSAATERGSRITQLLDPYFALVHPSFPLLSKPQLLRRVWSQPSTSSSENLPLFAALEACVVPYLPQEERRSLTGGWLERARSEVVRSLLTAWAGDKEAQKVEMAQSFLLLGYAELLGGHLDLSLRWSRIAIVLLADFESEEKERAMECAFVLQVMVLLSNSDATRSPLPFTWPDYLGRKLREGDEEWDMWRMERPTEELHAVFGSTPSVVGGGMGGTPVRSCMFSSWKERVGWCRELMGMGGGAPVSASSGMRVGIRVARHVAETELLAEVSRMRSRLAEAERYIPNLDLLRHYRENYTFYLSSPLIHSVLGAFFSFPLLTNEQRNLLLSYHAELQGVLPLARMHPLSFSLSPQEQRGAIHRTAIVPMDIGNLYVAQPLPPDSIQTPLSITISNSALSNFNPTGSRPVVAQQSPIASSSFPLKAQRHLLDTPMSVITPLSDTSLPNPSTSTHTHANPNASSSSNPNSHQASNSSMTGDLVGLFDSAQWRPTDILANLGFTTDEHDTGMGWQQAKFGGYAGLGSMTGMEALPPTGLLEAWRDMGGGWEVLGIGGAEGMSG
ncbi:hypothetical protein BT69DRAFT_1357203 [Atractiella rhizophila]|nr:hypothetical protein BT69DRAFT_1357203 [Atractiella rhizophila]